MPASAASLIPADEPEALTPRRSLGGWVWLVFLVLIFGLALSAYPPILDARQPVATPEVALFFGRFHPIAVHLPVGVLFLAALMDVLGMLRGPVGQGIRPAITFVMGIGAFGAIIAVFFGVLLSREGGYGSEMFKAHVTLGIVTAVLSILAFFFKLITDNTGRHAFVHRAVMVLTLAVMSVGAHMGGNLVHSSGYLLEHTPVAFREKAEWGEKWLLVPFGGQAPAPLNGGPAALTDPNSQPGTATVYAAVIAPLLDSKCATCHNAEKSKGDLRLDTHELIMQGGTSGDNVVPGQPEKSLMITRILIPVDQDDNNEHMPPPQKPQPTKEQIELLKWWVKEGASKDLKVDDANFPEELKPTVNELMANSTSGTGGSTPPIMLVMAEAAAPVDPAVAEAMKKINGSGASLAPIAADAKQLRFTALNVAKDYTDANLKDLEPIAASIVALDLAKSKITDAACDLIAKMTNLKELHLENTAVTDAGVEKLKGLANLEYLNLYGSKVTDKTLAVAEALPKLKSIYVWQTGVTRPAADALKAKRAGLTVNTGWTEADNAKVVAAAPAPAPAAPAPATTPKPGTPAPAPAPAPAAAKAKPTEAKPTGAGTALAKATDPNAKVFEDVVLPILSAKCTSCHGAEKSKGKLRLHTFAGVLKGGSDGATTVIPSNTKDSLMLVRAKLPKDDDDHMPPSDEPQLTKEEIALLEWWIAEGAKEDLTIGAAKKTPEIEGFLKALASSKGPGGAVAKKEEKPKAKPLTEAEKKTIAEITAKMTALNASLMPLALDTEQLRLGVVNAAEKFDDKALAELAPIAPQIAWVDLARSKVTDAGMATVAKMTNLERLHLENTNITDAGLAQLAGAAKLEYLNLYGTKVTDAGIAKLAANKALKKLFVWQTQVTKDGAKKLEAAVPGLVVNVGLSEAEIAKLIEAAKPPPPPPAPAPAPAAKKEEKKPEPPKPADPVKPTPAATPKPDAAKGAPPAAAAAPKPDAAKSAPPAPAPKPADAKKN